MSNSPQYDAYLERRRALTSGAPDLVIPCDGSGYLAYHRVQAKFLHGGLDHPVSAFRAEGRVDAKGCGAVETEHPFGGSVIEGYHRSMTVVLEGAVIECEDDGETANAPTEVRIWCADPVLRARIEASVRGAV